jgi:hypothetical protein
MACSASAATKAALADDYLKRFPVFMSHSRAVMSKPVVSEMGAAGGTGRAESTLAGRD